MKSEPTREKFEKWLHESQIDFEYEPFGNNQKNPDYSFKFDGKSYLVEVKDLIGLEGIFNPPIRQGVAFSIDQEKLCRKIKSRISKAAEQLKAHKEEFNFLLVVIGETGPIPIVENRSVFNAMFGSDYLSIPIDPVSKAAVIGKATLQRRTNGQLRYNKRLEGLLTMDTRHSYLSGVGYFEFTTPIKLSIISNVLGEKPITMNDLKLGAVNIEVPKIIRG